MPRKAFTKGKKKTRTGKFTRRRKAAGPTRVVSRTTPIPDRYFTKLRYSDLGALSFTGLGTPVYHQYNLNSLYDPDRSGGGHQPLGFDQLAALYNRYRVYGCKWKIYFTNRDTSYQCEVAAQSRPNSSVALDMSTIWESPYIKKCILGVEGSGQANKTIFGYSSIAKVFGVPKLQVKTDDGFAALIGASPAITPILTLYMQNQTTTTSAVVAYRVVLEFLCEFYDRALLSSS